MYALNIAFDPFSILSILWTFPVSPSSQWRGFGWFDFLYNDTCACQCVWKSWIQLQAFLLHSCLSEWKMLLNKTFFLWSVGRRMNYSWAHVPCLPWKWELLFSSIIVGLGCSYCPRAAEGMEGRREYYRESEWGPHDWENCWFSLVLPFSTSQFLHLCCTLPRFHVYMEVSSCSARVLKPHFDSEGAYPPFHWGFFININPAEIAAELILHHCSCV